MLSEIHELSDRPAEQLEDLYRFRRTRPEPSRNERGKALESDKFAFTVFSALLNSRVSFASYVEHKFVPDHVAHKAPAGRTHYQAMLKHILRPESVSRIFGNMAPTRTFLKSIRDWPYLDDVHLSDLTEDHVREILSAAMRNGYSAQTIKHIKNVIGAVISHARNEGCFSRPNPAEQLKLPPVTHKRRKALSAPDLSKALERMQYPEREIALLSMYTGLNLVAICDLRWKDLNLTFSPRVIDGFTLPPISIRISNPGKKTSAGACTSVEIPNTVLPALLDLKSRRGGTDPSDFVLVSANGTQVSPARVRSTLRQIGANLGISWISWQDFRKIHRKFVAEFLLKPYSAWAADAVLPPISRSLKGLSSPSVSIRPLR